MQSTRFYRPGPLRDRCAPWHGRRTWQQGRSRRRRVQTGCSKGIRRQRPRPISAICLQTITEIRSGRLDPKIANAPGYLGASYPRAVEVSDVQERLKALESSQRVEERAVLQSSLPDSEPTGEG
jgi:hypothetical protein